MTANADYGRSASVDPAVIVAQRAANWTDFHPEDYCHRCGRSNPVWWVDNELWNRATEHLETGAGSILCPSCFVLLLEQAEGGTRLVWKLAPDWPALVVPPQSTRTPPRCTCPAGRGTNPACQVHP